MNIAEIPLVPEWQALQSIVGAVEEIVSDAPVVGGGLLGLLLQREAIEPRISRLKSSLKNPTLLFQDIPKALVKILPGIDDIGVERQARIDCLWARLSELKVVAYLERRSGYSEIFQALDRIAARDAAYRKDTRRFLLLQAIVGPLHLLLFQQKHDLKPPYPTLLELKSAGVSAQRLSDFLKKKGSVYGIVDVPIALSTSLSKFVTEVDLAKRGYRKPRDDGLLRERDFGDQIIRAINTVFGKCSPTLVGRVLSFVDFEPDDRDLKARIKKITETARRKALVKALRGG